MEKLSEQALSVLVQWLGQFFFAEPIYRPCVLVGHDGSQLFNRAEIFSCFYTIFYDSFLRSYIYILIFIIIVLDFKVNNF